MRRKFLFLCTLCVLFAGMLGIFLVAQKNGAAFASRASSTGSPTTIFQNAFDTYAPGPLPTGTLANQWSTVKVSGTGYAVNVSNVQANSKPNSLQFTMGSMGYAYAVKKYQIGTATHAAKFSLYLDPSLVLGKQLIALFTARNQLVQKNGLFQLVLKPNFTLNMDWYDSMGVKHAMALGTASKLSTATWYTIELDQTNNATTGSWSLWLNGKQISSQSTIDTGNTLVDEIFAGDPIFNKGTVQGLFYEDNVVTATKHIG